MCVPVLKPVRVKASTLFVLFRIPILSQSTFDSDCGLKMNNNHKVTFGNNALDEPANEEFDEMHVSLMDYLGKFQPAMLHQLYQTSSVACMGVFRELPTLAQNVVLRMIFIDQPLPQAVVSSWVKSTRFVFKISKKKQILLDSFSDYNEAADALSRLHVWKACPLPTGLPGWLLNTTFRDNLRTAWLGG